MSCNFARGLLTIYARRDRQPCGFNYLFDRLFSRIFVSYFVARSVRRVHANVYSRVTDCDKPSKRVSTFTANIMQNLTSFTCTQV